ncbi:MAG: prepilin-type N-terminal cleavage/methylation domain-containing protein [Gammaproteobacteria bacterium]
MTTHTLLEDCLESTTGAAKQIPKAFNFGTRYGAHRMAARMIIGADRTFTKRSLHGGGFTLLEVLVTLVIVATASTIIYTHLKTVLDLTRRHQESERETSAVLNRAAALPTLAIDGLRITVGEDHLLIEDPRRTPDEAPLAVEVRNLPPDGSDVPVTLAFTPYQQFRVEVGGKYSLALIQRGLPAPRR